MLHGIQLRLKILQRPYTELINLHKFVAHQVPKPAFIPFKIFGIDEHFYASLELTVMVIAHKHPIEEVLLFQFFPIYVIHYHSPNFLGAPHNIHVFFGQQVIVPQPKVTFLKEIIPKEKFWYFHGVNLVDGIIIRSF
jgi:hypothetical protein